MREKQKNQKKKYCKINNKNESIVKKRNEKENSKKENSISCCSVLVFILASGNRTMIKAKETKCLMKLF